MGVGKIQLGEIILIDIYDYEMLEVWMILVGDVIVDLVLIVLWEIGIEYLVDDYGDEFYIFINVGDVEDFKIVIVLKGVFG